MTKKDNSGRIIVETRKSGEMAKDIPVACTLTEAELREREARILAKFKSAVAETEELPDGYLFRLPGNAASVAIAAELISAERECCRFMKFELTAEPDMGPLRLRISGPSGTKDLLKSVLLPI